MNKRKGIIRILFLLFAVLFINGIYADAAVLKIAGMDSEKVIYTGHKYQLEAKVPKAYRDKKLKWTSSDVKVGKISQEGVFSAKKAGTTKVCARVAGTKLRGEIYVTVTRFVKTKAVKIENMKKSLGVGSTLQLEAAVTPAKAVEQDVEWSSDNPQIASITSKGKIKAKAVGKVTITASVKNTDVKVSFKLRVKEAVPLKSLKIRKSAKTMEEGESLQLKAKRSPSNTTFTNLIWKSSNEGIATVSENGEVHALKAGKVKITVKSPETKKKASIRITVNPKIVLPTGITFSGNNAKTVEFGSKVQLHAKVTPANTTNQKIIWSSGDTSKATVDQNGVVTAIRPTEMVKITAKTANKKYSAVYTLQITANHGFLTKADLDKLNLDSIKKVMIVAHPDDETLWGGSHLLDSEYLVVCLTNGWHKTRNADFLEVMNRTNEKCIILSYPDTKNEYWSGGVWSYDTDTLSTCQNGIKKDLDLILSYKNWEMVVTHNPDGEYRKYCHQMTSKLVTESFRKNLNGKAQLYYFGHYYDKGTAIPGERITEENLNLKTVLIQCYLPTAKGAIDAFGHMIPYENWIPAAKWSTE